MVKSDDGTWDQSQMHVVEELKRLNHWLGQLNETQQRMREDIASLKVKAGAWGFVAGLIPVLIALGVAAASRGKP
jgi:hypothetical protein